MKGIKYSTASSPTAVLTQERPGDRYTAPLATFARAATNVPARIYKRGHIRTPSLGVLAKGSTVLSNHVRVISSVQNVRPATNGYRPTTTMQRRAFSPEEFLAVADFYTAATATGKSGTFGNFMRGLATRASGGGTFDCGVRIGTATNPAPQLHIVRKNIVRKATGMLQEPAVKEVRHIGMLLGTIKPDSGKVKHIKRGSVNYLDARTKTSKPEASPGAVLNWGVSGKRYSPTAKYLHMKKVIMFETKETTQKAAEMEGTAACKKAEEEVAAAGTFNIFTDSFRYLALIFFS